MFNRTINNFLQRFGRTTTISPTDWDRVVFRFNLIYITIESIIIFATSAGILSFIFPFGIKLIALLAIVLTGLRIMGHIRKFSNFLEVPYGHIGIITLLGDVKGSIEDGNRYYLIPGKYRDMVDMLFYKNIFNIVLPPTQFDNFDYHFEDVFTKDGVALQGTHTGRPELVDPWRWTSLYLSTKDEKIHYKKVEDISLEAMNEAADDDDLKSILKVGIIDGDGSDNFKRNYLKELNRLRILVPTKAPFLNSENWNENDFKTEIEGEEKFTKFYFPETGLNITFNIKTRAPMDPELRKALAAETRERESKKAIEIKAEAEKTKLKLEGEGKAAAEKAILNATAEAYEAAFLKYRGLGLNKKISAQKAALSANLYATEIVTEIGNSNGTPIEGGFDLLKIIALIKAMSEKKSDKKEN